MKVDDKKRYQKQMESIDEFRMPVTPFEHHSAKKSIEFLESEATIRRTKSQRMSDSDINISKSVK